MKDGIKKVVTGPRKEWGGGMKKGGKLVTSYMDAPYSIQVVEE